MKTKLSITVSLIFLCAILSGQGQLPPWLIEWAPGGPGYVLYSGPGGVYNHALLSTLVSGGDTTPDSNLYTVNGSIIDPIRTVNLSTSRLIFYDTGNGYVSIENNRDAGLFSIKKTGDTDSLVFKNDYGIGGDYGLFLEGAGGLRNIFSVTGNTYSLGAGFNILKIEANLALNNNATRLLAYDPVTENVEQIDISSIVGSSYPCRDTIIQASHGLSLGDLVGQLSAGYFLANTASADSLPVAFACSIIDANTFTISTEGWIDWIHGQSVDTDYFLQDDGSFGTSPDSDYTVFAFRTFGADKAAFDIPELVVDGSAGGGGSSPGVTASNGLNDQDVSTDVDVELGGSLDKNTTVETEGFNLYLGDNTGNDLSYFRCTPANTVLMAAFDATTSASSTLTVIETGTVIETNAGTAGTFTSFEAGPQVFNRTVSTGGVTQTQFIQNNSGYTMLGVPAYADDAAAATAGLTTGALYQTTGTAPAPLNVAGILMIKQ